MATFNFPNFTFGTEYPDSSFRVTLGSGYQFTAPPSAPDQRKFTLKFAVMKYFQAGGGMDRTSEPTINLMLLEDFYNAHKLNLAFTFPHPVYGDLTCRFDKPLRIPDGVPGGGGAVLNIEINLIEVPGVDPSGESEMLEIVYEDFP